MWLDTSGKRLVQWPIEEINNLRTRQVNLDSRQLQGGSILEIAGITASQVCFCQESIIYWFVVYID